MTRRTVLLTAGVCTLVIGAWFQLLWSPQGSELDDARNRRQVALGQVQQLRVELARLQDTRDMAPALEASAERLDVAIPETPSIAEFLLAAHEAAAAAGVDWLTVTPSPPAAAVPGAPAEIQISMDVKAEYFQLLDYLDRVLGLDRLLVIDSLQLTPEGSGPDAPLLSVSLSGRLFTTGQPEAPAAPATPDPATDGVPPVTTTVPAGTVAAPSLSSTGGSR